LHDKINLTGYLNILVLILLQTSQPQNFALGNHCFFFNASNLFLNSAINSGVCNFSATALNITSFPAGPLRVLKQWLDKNYNYSIK